MLSAYERIYIPDSKGIFSKGSARRFTTSGQEVTLRVPVAMLPSTPAKLALHSVQRMAFNAPNCPK